MGDRISVLLVDDEGVFISFIAEQLREECGFSTEVAFSGQEALQKLQSPKYSFDVVVLDYLMPEVSGLNVLQWMHEQKIETPVIMLTAQGTEQVAVEAMKLGAYDYLRKEHIDVHHLGLSIQAAHERHQFRIQKAQEEERQLEIRLNREATDRVRSVLNILSPVFNDALATISVELEDRGAQVLQRAPDSLRSPCEALLQTTQRNVALLERGIQSLLDLYEVLYARHTDAKRIEEIKAEVETTLVER